MPVQWPGHRDLLTIEQLADIFWDVSRVAKIFRPEIDDLCRFNGALEGADFHSKTFDLDCLVKDQGAQLAELFFGHGPILTT